MPACPVCNAEESREELVDEVFQIDGRYVLVGGFRLRFASDAVNRLSAGRPRRRFARWFMVKPRRPGTFPCKFLISFPEQDVGTEAQRVRLEEVE